MQGMAYDLWDMIRGTRTRCRNGETETRFLWREQQHWPLSFTANFGVKRGWSLTFPATGAL